MRVCVDSRASLPGMWAWLGIPVGVAWRIDRRGFEVKWARYICEIGAMNQYYMEHSVYIHLYIIKSI